ncbi:MAG: hypothetical protein AB1486_21515 [Planctomycetota bacterium]
MSSEQPEILIARPCPGRRKGLEALVDGFITRPEQEALERHLAGCPCCQGYRTFLEVQNAHVRALATRPRKPVKLAAARRHLEEIVSRMTASDAAEALVALARWYFARRENPDPTVYSLQVPGQRARRREQALDALHRWQERPWLKKKTRGQLLLAALPPDLELPADVDNRSFCRLALDSALDIDPSCYRAAQTRVNLLREGGYEEMSLFEKDCETLLATDDSRLQAEALSQRAGWLSIAKTDIDGALALKRKAAELDPTQMYHLFNVWFLSVLTGDKNSTERFYQSLAAIIRKESRESARNRRRMTAWLNVLRTAHDEGHLAPSVHARCVKAIEKLLREV